MTNRIKVMIVDDSALVRKVMAEVLETDSGINVIAHASDPIFAIEKMKKQRPDVIILDIEMPRMDGITFLKKIMKEDPLPVVICSSHTKEGADFSVKALQNGAVEIITKPQIGVKGFIEESKTMIVEAIKGASKARMKKLKIGSDFQHQTNNTLPKASLLDTSPKHNADVVLLKTSINSNIVTDKIIALGASTGGTQALREVLANMPANSPGILIVQHMPEEFTKSFAQNLDQISPVCVKEAQNNDQIVSGTALVSPGNRHMLLRRAGNRYFVELVDGALVNRHKPSVDVLFRSVARYAGKNAVGCLMTGMGADGAVGLKEMRDAGARTFSQDEKSSVVYGMPKEAWQMGASEIQLELSEISAMLITTCNKMKND